jgi:fucose permease
MRRISFKQPNEGSSSRALSILHVGFLLTGTLTTMLGPLLPAFSKTWALEDSQAGYLFTAQFFGSILGVLLSSKAIASVGLLNSLTAGFAAICASIAVLGFVPFAPGVLCIIVYGVGLGLTIPATNLLIAELNPTRRAESLNILNLLWGIGALVSPPLLGPLALHQGIQLPLLGLAFLFGGVSLTLYLLSPDTLKIDQRDEIPPREMSGLWSNAALILIAVSAFLYVGLENAISGWLSSYGLRTGGAERFWSFVPSIFWATILLGRAAAPALLRRCSPIKLILVGVIIALLGTIVLLSWRSMTGLIVGAGLAGLGCAPIFPTTIAILSETFGRFASRLASIVFGLAALGGAIIPWLVGVISSHYQSLQIGLTFTVFVTSLLFLLQLSLLLTLRSAPRAYAK